MTNSETILGLGPWWQPQLDIGRMAQEPTHGRDTDITPLYDYHVVATERRPSDKNTTEKVEVSLVRITTKADTNNRNLGNDDQERIHKWLNRAAGLLLEQWPRGGPLQKYHEKLIHNYTSQVERYGLPCSYVLVSRCNEDSLDTFSHSTCIGHGRLMECFESAGGNAAAATFILIHKSYRGQGWGGCLMEMLEQEAKRLGYHYVYLWTKTAIPFYQRLGYTECPKVVLKRACLQQLEANQVESLEGLLRKKQQQLQQQQQQSNKSGNEQSHPTSKPLYRETVLLLPSGDHDGEEDLPDVWLRKRLVEHVGSIQISREKQLQQLKETILEHERFVDPSSDRRHPVSVWRYQLVSLPWQSQIGPSCGLAALRMVREYFMNQHNSQDAQEALPSLLGEAQERGFTRDGEIFNIRHLQELAEQVCGMKGQLESTRHVTPQQVHQTLSSNHSLWILPYDSEGRTKLPTCLAGERAHYGVIVGMVFPTKLQSASPFEEGTNNENTNKTETRTDMFYPWDPESKSAPNEEDDEEISWDQVNQIFLLVQHGLSDQLSIAPWTDFMASNQQLSTLDESRFGPQENLDLQDRILLCTATKS